jgi:hypothetical protein
MEDKSSFNNVIEPDVEIIHVHKPVLVGLNKN